MFTVVNINHIAQQDPFFLLHAFNMVKKLNGDNW